MGDVVDSEVRRNAARSALHLRPEAAPDGCAFGLGCDPLLVIAPPWEYAHLAGPIPRDGPLAWVGLVLFAGGVVLQAAAIRALHGLYTTRLGMQPGHRLVTSGPYRVVRHPGYLSQIMCMTGIGLALSSLVGLGLAVFVLPLFVYRMGEEETMLLAAFGEEYRAYKERVRWRLFPLVH